MIGAVLRSDKRKYGDIVKAGLIFGLIFGILSFFVTFLLNIQYPMARALTSLISGIFGMIIYFLLGAIIYDLSNYFIDN